MDNVRTDLILKAPDHVHNDAKEEHDGGCQDRHGVLVVSRNIKIVVNVDIDFGLRDPPLLTKNHDVKEHHQHVDRDGENNFHPGNQGSHYSYANYITSSDCHSYPLSIGEDILGKTIP